MAPPINLPPIRRASIGGSRAPPITKKWRSNNSLNFHPSYEDAGDQKEREEAPVRETVAKKTEKDNPEARGGTQLKRDRKRRRNRKKHKPSMRVFLTYESERHSIDVTDNQTVADIKLIVRTKFNMGPDPGPGGIGRDRKVLALFHMGSDLNDDWIMHDVGIQTGSTIKVTMKEESKPILYLHCLYNDEITPILEKSQVPTMKVSELRSMVTRKTGIPIGVFRMVSPQGQEMFDCNNLSDYQIDIGDCIKIETWDGWNDFLNLCIMGFTSHVLNHLSSDELLAKYQMKVAMYLAAHFGHVDLAMSLLRQGIRADEVVGDHPSRTWCRDVQLHVDALKTPVHVSAEQGQLGVLRSFVHHSLCNVLAKDGNDLTPLNIALRRKQKPCASFLLTKQWSKINYTNKTIPLNIFVRMKRWAERSKEKVLIVHGQWKSSVKNPKRFLVTGSLVGHGVYLDGFSDSKMTSKSSAQVKAEEELAAQKKKKRHSYLIEEKGKESGELQPEQYFKSISMAHSLKLPKLNKWNKMFKNVAADKLQSGESADNSDSDSDISTEITERRDEFKLPPIQENMSKVGKRRISNAHQNFMAGGKMELEFGEGKSTLTQSRASFIQTGKQSRPEYARVAKKKKRKDFTTDLLAKAKTAEAGVSLPMVSVDAPRPFMRSSKDDFARQTLLHYEKYRGIKARDYAIKCLAIANSFKEKPWLHQVRQAMSIAAQGVRKTVTNRGHLFASQSQEKTGTESHSLVETQSLGAVTAE